MKLAVVARRRYMLTQDSSCHWYVIPVEEKEQFDKWDEAAESYWEGYEGRDFTDCAVGGSYTLVTFTEPEIG